MKIKIIKGVNWILASLIGMLGFSGCLEWLGISPDMYGSPYKEYGCPSADYTVKGAVIDKVTEDPIPGIRVGYSPAEWNEEAFGPQPEHGETSGVFVITNPNGEFTLTGSFFGYGQNITFPVFLDDVDGEENGLYQTEKIDVNFKNAVNNGNSSRWYEGEYTVTTTFQLTPVIINE